MKITIINDKKKRHQSFEAFANSDYANHCSHGRIDLCGYGANEVEAKQSLLSLAQDMIVELRLVAITDDNPDLKMVQVQGVLTKYTGGVDGRQHEEKHKAKNTLAKPNIVIQVEDILGKTFDESLWSTIQNMIALPIDEMQLYQTFAVYLAKGYSPRNVYDWINEYTTNAHYSREYSKQTFGYLLDKPKAMPYHASVRAIAEVIGYNPDWLLHGAIVAAMEAAGGIDTPRLEQCYADWCAKGYNKYNLEAWFFERYVQESPYRLIKCHVI